MMRINKWSLIRQQWGQWVKKQWMETRLKVEAKTAHNSLGTGRKDGAGFGCGILGFLPPNSDSDILTFNVKALGRLWGWTPHECD